MYTSNHFKKNYIYMFVLLFYVEQKKILFDSE